MTRLLIVGAGDVARRLLPLLIPRYRVYVLLRNPAHGAWWRERGAIPVVADLDRRTSLRRLRGLADWVVHLAPPPGQGEDDPRTRHLVAALRRPARRAAYVGSIGASSLPQRLVYISTSGVYGDCAGARIDETRPRRPATARAARRVAAEAHCRRLAAAGVRVSILRVPGIYAADRLPLARLREGTPALNAEDDVFTSHVHADDLARIIVAALLHGRSGRAYHAVDDSEMRMGEYFDAVADAFGLPRSPRIARQVAGEQMPATLLSFMSESRRLSNARMKRELRVRLRYPTVAAGLAAARATTRS